ncbi:unnamed protein product [Urochloa humidicola]
MTPATPTNSRAVSVSQGLPLATAGSSSHARCHPAATAMEAQDEVSAILHQNLIGNTEQEVGQPSRDIQ